MMDFHLPVEEITLEDFPGRVVQADGPVLVAFGDLPGSRAEKFVQCAQGLCGEADGMRLVRVHSGDDPVLMRAFGIPELPALLLYDQGRPLGLCCGEKTMDQLRLWIRPLLSSSRDPGGA